MTQNASGETPAHPYADDDGGVTSLSRYFNDFLLVVCGNTPDLGLLAVVLHGQAEEWEARVGRWPLAAEHAALCRLTLRAIELRVRARLAAIEPQLARLDAACTVMA